MKYKNLCTVYCFHHGSLERCWHLNARLLGDVRMRPASGLSWGQGYGAGVLFGFWFNKSIASSQMQGQWGQCWTHTAPLRNKGARWLLHCAFLVKIKKKSLKVTVAEAVHQKRGSAYQATHDFTLYQREASFWGVWWSDMWSKTYSQTPMATWLVAEVTALPHCGNRTFTPFNVASYSDASESSWKMTDWVACGPE